MILFYIIIFTMIIFLYLTYKKNRIIQYTQKFLMARIKTKLLLYIYDKTIETSIENLALLS